MFICKTINTSILQAFIQDLSFGGEVQSVKGHELPRSVRGHAPGNFLKWISAMQSSAFW